jgi:hypothetical protein
MGTTNSTIPYPIPERWIIAPRNGTEFLHERQCPPPTATMLTFLTTNILTGLLSLPLGFRPLVERLTRKRFGKRFIVDNAGGPGDRSRGYMWLFPFALQLLANLFIAVAIQQTPGYGETSIGNIMLLYLFRPRFTWILLTITNRFTGYEHRKKTFVRRGKRRWTVFMGEVEIPDEQYVPQAQRKDIERPWNSSRISSCVAEAVLQFMAMIYVCTTWNQSNHRKDLALSIMIIFSYPWPILVCWALLSDSLWPICFVSYGISWAFFTVMVLNAGDL